MPFKEQCLAWIRLKKPLFFIYVYGHPFVIFLHISQYETSNFGNYTLLTASVNINKSIPNLYIKRNSLDCNSTPEVYLGAKFDFKIFHYLMLYQIEIFAI